MGFSQKTKRRIEIFKNYADEIGLNMLALYLGNFVASPKSEFFCSNFSDILECIICISSPSSAILIVLYMRSKDELQQKTSISQYTEKAMKRKSITGIINDAHFEYSIGKTGKTILLFLRFFEVLKVM